MNSNTNADTQSANPPASSSHAYATDRPILTEAEDRFGRASFARHGGQTAEHSGGFPPIMVARIRGLMYRQFFFCPRAGAPLTSDSVARLDRLQVVIHESSPGVRSAGYEPTQCALSADALGVIMGMLRSQFGSTAEEHLEAVRSLAMEAIPDTARPVK